MDALRLNDRRRGLIDYRYEVAQTYINVELEYVEEFLPHDDDRLTAVIQMVISDINTWGEDAECVRFKYVLMRPYTRGTLLNANIGFVGIVFACAVNVYSFCLVGFWIFQWRLMSDSIWTRNIERFMLVKKKQYDLMCFVKRRDCFPWNP